MAKAITLEELKRLPKPATPNLFMGMDLTRPDPIDAHYRTRKTDLWDAVLSLIPGLPPELNSGPWEAWTYGRDEIQLVATFTSPSHHGRESSRLGLYVLLGADDTNSTVRLAPNVQVPPEYIVALFAQLDALFERVT